MQEPTYGIILNIFIFICTQANLITTSSLMWCKLPHYPLFDVTFPSDAFMSACNTKNIGKNKCDVHTKVLRLIEENMYIKKMKTAEQSQHIFYCDELNAEFDKFGLKCYSEDEAFCLHNRSGSLKRVNHGCNNILHNTFCKVL